MTARPRPERTGSVLLFAIAFFLLLAVSCTKEEPVTWVTVVFDVEDYTSPASEGRRPDWELALHCSAV
jgi:hypothetical protein